VAEARVIVIGGRGNFGARIVRALCGQQGTEILVAGRRAEGDCPGNSRPVVLDISSDHLAADLAAFSPLLVIHCAGPFQAQDYQVAQAALRAGAHYLDLADGRDFVAGFGRANDALARSCGRTALTGASTLPALSSAVVDHLAADLAAVESIETAIAPGQRAPRGVATLQAVFSYLGRPVKVWEEGTWRTRTGWMDLRRIPLSFGSRWGALCDVPDLELFPQRYPSLRTMRFHAALEFGVQHGLLWLMAALRRSGMPLPMDRWAKGLHCAAGWFDGFAGRWGGMRIRVVGRQAEGQRVARTWQLAVSAVDGPEIPCMAAILVARRILSGESLPAGAAPCAGLLTLQDFAPEFARWNIHTDIRESDP
jgi:hypothetical protein